MKQALLGYCVLVLKTGRSQGVDLLCAILVSAYVLVFKQCKCMLICVKKIQQRNKIIIGFFAVTASKILWSAVEMDENCLFLKILILECTKVIIFLIGG